MAYDIPVVFAHELPDCPGCGEEPYCQLHKKHFADCSCVGPTEDGYDYIERDGKLWAKKL